MNTSIRNRLNTLLVGILCTSLCACTTLRPLPLTSGADVGSSETSGQGAKQYELKVTLKGGEVVWLTEASTNDKSVNGLRSDGTAASIPLEQVGSVESRERSAAKTAGLVLVGVVGVVAVLYMLGAALSGGGGAAAIASAP